MIIVFNTWTDVRKFCSSFVCFVSPLENSDHTSCRRQDTSDCRTVVDATGNTAALSILLLPHWFKFESANGVAEAKARYTIESGISNLGLFRRSRHSNWLQERGRGVTRSKQKPLASGEITATPGGGSGKSADSSRRPTPWKPASRSMERGSTVMILHSSLTQRGRPARKSESDGGVNRGRRIGHIYV